MPGALDGRDVLCRATLQSRHLLDGFGVGTNTGGGQDGRSPVNNRPATSKAGTRRPSLNAVTARSNRPASSGAGTRTRSHCNKPKHVGCPLASTSGTVFGVHPRMYNTRPADAQAGTRGGVPRHTVYDDCPADAHAGTTWSDVEAMSHCDRPAASTAGTTGSGQLSVHCRWPGRAKHVHIRPRPASPARWSKSRDENASTHPTSRCLQSPCNDSPVCSPAGTTPCGWYRMTMARCARRPGPELLRGDFCKSPMFSPVGTWMNQRCIGMSPHCAMAARWRSTAGTCGFHGVADDA